MFDFNKTWPLKLLEQLSTQFVFYKYMYFVIKNFGAENQPGNSVSDVRYSQSYCVWQIRQRLIELSLVRQCLPVCGLVRF